MCNEKFASQNPMGLTYSWKANKKLSVTVPFWLLGIFPSIRPRPLIFRGVI